MPRTPHPQPVNLYGMDKPALHPERIRQALRHFKRALEIDQEKPFSDGVSEVESAIAALELIRKSQLAVGLTGQVVDAGRSAMDLLEVLRRIGK